jgi:NiFe hydrogenase small subunit HydA
MEVGRMPDEEMSVFRGVTRRDFLKFCGGLAVVLGFGPAGTAEVAAALEKLAKRPQVIYSSFQQCTGCAVQLLQTQTPTVADLIFQQISLEFQDNVMAAAGDAAEKHLEEIVSSGDFYWMVEGSIPTKIPEACTIAGENATERAKRIAAKAKGIIAYGNCACYGNIQASNPNPTGAMGVAEFLHGPGGMPDAKVINMSRCPGQSEDTIAAISYVLVTGKLPELVKLYETEGIEIQKDVLGGFVGAFTTDIGALSTYTSMWRYASFAEREERRAALLARDDWKAFMGKIQPLIHTQQNRILTPTPFSAIR